MPVRYNPTEDKAIRQDKNGEWVDARRAINQGGDVVVLDGKTWTPVRVKALPSVAYGLHGMGASMSAMKGLSLGFAPKMMAKAMPGDYEENLGALQRRQAQYEKANPGTALTAELAGGMATGAAGTGKLIASRMFQNAPTLLKAAGLVGVGAGEGAVAGAGYAPPGQEVEGAKTGAQVGAALGVGLPLIGKGAHKVFQVVSNKIGEKGAKSWMQNKLAEAMQRDGISVEEAQQRLASGDYGQYATIFDIGGEALENLSRAITSMPGKAQSAAREFFETRAAGAGKRALQSVNKMLETKGDFYKTFDDLKKGQKNISDKLYGQARDEGLVMTKKLRRILQGEGIAEAYAAAKRTASIGGRELPEFVAPSNLSRVRAADTRSDGVVNEIAPDLDTIDTIKRGIDKKINQSKNALGKIDSGDPDIRAWINLRKRLLAEVDDINKTYPKARAAYAGFARQQDAMQLGRNFLKGDVELMAGRMGKLSVDERAAFMEGVSRQIGDMLDNNMNAANVIRQLLKKGKYQKALSEVMGDNVDQFNKFLKTEMKYSDVAYKSFGGSQTARIMEEQKDFFLDPELLQAAAFSVATKSPLPVVGAAGRKMSDFFRRPPEKARDAAAGLYTSDLAEIQRFLARSNAENLAQSARGGYGHGGLLGAGVVGAHRGER